MNSRSLLIAGALGATLLATPSAFATTGCNAVGWDERHADVHGCDLYYPAIEWMYDEGIAEGEAGAGGQRFFHPERAVNRAEFTKLVLLGSGDRSPPAPCATAPFPDVPKDAWYAPYVCAAKAEGIIGGYPDGTFRPAANINDAEAAKILVGAFDVETRPEDLTAIDGESLWYKPYVLALSRQNAVAPTVAAFNALITRGEMAEMIYRLSEGKPSYVMPTDETDNEPLGMGYTNPFSLETTLGLWVDAPDAPYVFAPVSTDLWDTMPTINGFRFFHDLPEVRCTESGLWEHCDPVFVDWSIALYVTDRPVADAAEKLLLPGQLETLWFGGRKGTCSTMGVEGENVTFCFVPLKAGKTLVVQYDWIDTNVAYTQTPGITPIAKADAWFARIRSSMAFVDGL